MLRGDNIICGTTTTSTGTLSLAATPGPPGGIDFDVWIRAIGGGATGNSKSFLVPYTIIEYTDSTFATAKQTEQGIGTLTTGGSSGIANCTLARTTIRSTGTSLHSQPASTTLQAATAITIGTAANVLVFIGVSSSDVVGALPYSSAGLTTLSRDGAGVPTIPNSGLTSFLSLSITNNTLYYLPMKMEMPLSASKLRVRCSGAYTGQNNNLYGAIYDIDTTGYPGKLLADFAQFATLNASFASAGVIIATAALGTPLDLRPGWYYVALQAIWTLAGTGTPAINTYPQATVTGGSLMLGTSTLGGVNFVTATGGTAAFADTASLTGLSAATGAAANPPVVFVGP